MPRLVHANLGDCHDCNIEFTAAFDVNQTKVGRELPEAIFVEVSAKGFQVDRGMVVATGGEAVTHRHPLGGWMPPERHGMAFTMTTFYIIRHATNDLVGKVITGRRPGIGLNPEGRRQAEQLAKRLAREPIQIVYSSPRERAVETAVPLAKRLNLDIQISEAFDEIDFGDWTGLTFEQLAPLPKWQRWNSFRGVTRIPGGEMMCEVQTRMVMAIQGLHAEYPEQTIAVFSHGDPIRATLAYYLGVPLDLLQRIRVDPASVSIITLNEEGPEVLGMNG
ncbi:MAG: Phosphoglycerate mutase [Pedosphaera sp.]|nr:Phosphoglycerate mutase [Pedosphaera sp.]